MPNISFYVILFKTRTSIFISPDIKIDGKRILVPSKVTRIARCVIPVFAKKSGTNCEIIAKVNEKKASAKLIAVEPRGSGISIKLEDVDHAKQRYIWKSNVIEIAARHPSLRRYLGKKSHGFPGQEKPHFRILLAEIVADAVCSNIIVKREAEGHYEGEIMDWEFFYAEKNNLMTEFLPIAHDLQIKPSES